MRFGIKTLDDIETSGKTILLRVDINEPVDKKTGKLKDITRIEASIPTIKELMEKKAKVVLMAHQGSDIEYKNYYTTRPHVDVISELLGKKIKFIEDICGPAARTEIQTMQKGDVLMLDNVRFCAEEQTLFENNIRLTQEEMTKTQLIQKLSPLADYYVCDAFAAAHRNQPSLCGFEYVLPSAMGRLFEEEYCIISQLMEEPNHPCVFLLGGAKVEDAFLMMKTVLERKSADKILTGGLVANILLLAKGEKIGKGSEDFIYKQNFETLIPKAKELLLHYEDSLVLPLDLAWTENGKRVESEVGNIPDMATVTDIGSKSAAFYSRVIQSAATVFANGPMGIFEEKEAEIGTKAVMEAMGNTDAYTVVGGGDSITAAKKFNQQDKINYLCTGGGALIRMLTGAELPVVKALRHGTEVK